MNIFSKFKKTYRILDSETYRETISSTERLASASYRLFANKTPEEQSQILERVTELSSKLHDAIDHETPLIVALTLLTAVRAHDQLLQEHVENSK